MSLVGSALFPPQGTSASGGASTDQTMFIFSGETIIPTGSPLNFVTFGFYEVESTAETARNFRVSEAVTLSDMHVYIRANSITSGNTTITIYKNGVSTTLQVTVGPGATGNFEDLSNSVSFAKGDRVSIGIDASATSGGTSILVTSVSGTAVFDQMATWTPETHPGFVLDPFNQTIVSAPAGNTKTYADILAEHIALKPPLPPPEQKTTETFVNEQATDKSVEITDANDVLGESAYAEISNLTPGTQQTGISDTYTKITQFDTVGLNKNITVSGPNNNLTITKAGFYSVFYSLSFSGTANETFIVVVHNNDTEVVKSSTVRRLGASGDVGTLSSRCILQLAVNDVIDLRVRTNVAGSNNMTLQTGNFIIEKMR